MKLLFLLAMGSLLLINGCINSFSEVETASTDNTRDSLAPNETSSVSETTTDTIIETEIPVLPEKIVLTAVNDNLNPISLHTRKIDAGKNTLEMVVFNNTTTPLNSIILRYEIKGSDNAVLADGIVDTIQNGFDIAPGEEITLNLFIPFSTPGGKYYEIYFQLPSGQDLAEYGGYFPGGQYTNFCGNKLCETGETCYSCNNDCPSCLINECGNGTCENGENSATCSADCTDTSTCGDGVCQSNEYCYSCSSDCGACGCVEDWSCSGWSACVNKQQTRTCTDNASCGTTSTKPSVVQSCSTATGDLSIEGNLTIHGIGTDGAFSTPNCSKNQVLSFTLINTTNQTISNLPIQLTLDGVTISPTWASSFAYRHVIPNTGVGPYQFPPGTHTAYILFNHTVWNNHAIQITVDPTNIVDETDETNNSVGSGFTGNLMDLSVGTMRYDSTFNKVFIPIQRSGTDDCPVFNSVIYVDGVLVDDDPGFYGFTGTSPSDVWGPSLSSGTHDVRIVIDTGNVFEESNEANNDVTQTITV